jgi:dephospho-CoA kinase
VFKVGLTGGIGCGKTTVSKLFAELDVPVIDADKIAYQLVEPGQPALYELAKVFGKVILNTNGTLNRKVLGDRIYVDQSQKLRLESILHPLIFAKMQTIIDHLDNAYCIASIPLLFETNMTGFVDRILVIDCPVETQFERVRLRDNLEDSKIKAIIDSQVSREYRLSHADDILDNFQSDTDGLAEHVKKLHNLYFSISASFGITRL